MDDGEDLQMDQNMVMVQELLRATTVASTEQRKLFSSQSEVEKSAFILENFTRPDWISFVSSYDIYENKDGEKNMGRLLGPTVLKVCAKTVTHTTIRELREMDNSTLLSILNKHFAVGTASNYKEVLQGLAMNFRTSFCRQAIENYATFFLAALIDNPTFVNSMLGGTSEE